jgi:tetratricopeptide (TPR) repeat protein
MKTNLLGDILFFALRQTLQEVGQPLADWIESRFHDQSQALPQALESASESTWRVFENAVEGDVLPYLLASGEVKTLTDELQGILQGKGDAFRTRCRDDLRRLHGQGLAQQQTLDAATLTQGLGSLQRYGDPQSLIRAAWAFMDARAQALRDTGFPALAELLSIRLPGDHPPFLLAVFGFFLRQEVSGDETLSKELHFDLLTHLQASVDQLAMRVGELLDRIDAGAGLLRPEHSRSITNQRELLLVERMVAEYRALGAEEQQRYPNLLEGLGRLLFATGRYRQAMETFERLTQDLADTQGDTRQHAQALHNLYLAGLEEGKAAWPRALEAIKNAVRLDPSLAPFDLKKYTPKRILGVGGFGVTFLVSVQPLGEERVVKALHPRGLGRPVEAVMKEARLLMEVKHPGVIRVLDADHEQGRYLVLEHFAEETLERRVLEQGPLTPAQLRPIARQLAEALGAVHDKGILHRDLKPANILVRDGGDGLETKIIDFGLAQHGHATDAQGALSGDLAYSAPEQLGRIQAPVGRPADLYALGKTLLFALSRRTEWTADDWRGLEAQDPGLAALLNRCLQPSPEARPADCAGVLSALDRPWRTDVPRDPCRNRLAFAVLATLAVGGVAGVAGERAWRAAKDAGLPPAVELNAQLQDARAQTARLQTENQALMSQGEAAASQCVQDLEGVKQEAASSCQERLTALDVEHQKATKQAAETAAAEKAVSEAKLADLKDHLVKTGYRYLDNGDGTITDTQTKLQWMRCSQGQTWSEGACKGAAKTMGWEAAKGERADFAGHNDWRLPTIEELRTLVWCSNGKPDYFSQGKHAASGDSGCQGEPGKDHQSPTIDLLAFPNTQPNWFWSSSAYANYSNSAWIVNFPNGYDSYLDRDINAGP